MGSMWTFYSVISFVVASIIIAVCCFCAISRHASAQTVEPRFPQNFQNFFTLPPYQPPANCLTEEPRLLHYRKGPYIIDMGVMVRGYYLNDQRIQWSGNECTMGAEGILTPSIKFDRKAAGTWSVHGEFFLQDTLNANAYRGDPSFKEDDDGNDDRARERASYFGNYNDEPFKISQLHVRYKNPHFEFRVGKFDLPFGNYTAPLMSNSRWDAPFIRTESILWRDTGFMFRFTPSVFDVAVAITNGCEGDDTNSMKAFTGRAGLNFSNVTLGTSIFWHDGEGSEEQKQYRRHAGADASVRFGNWVLSSEIIYDEYGMRRDFDPNDIFWQKSIYYRQINKANNTPITGWGGYVDLSCHYHAWIFSVNYGEYYPEQLRKEEYPQHDIINRRALVKAAWNFTQHLQWYGALLFETEGFTAQSGRARRGYAMMSGVKMEF